MSNQDWDVRVLNKNKSNQLPKGQKGINQAQQKGAPIATSKKFAAGGNKQGAVKDIRPLEATTGIDEDGESLSHNKISKSQAAAIQKGRAALKLTQAQLAQKINEQASIVNSYERADGIPDQRILGKLERVLGVRLRGKNVGEPFVKK
eukprot:TRINITY_DN3603_c0_g1_i1.p1 TRINITY_DN3603_c0_g1~~TRINITY_DN3603_c0_g1_i1.p1  ORF type:complete len:164 (-),score=54.33 TRINITY_DN3603_c0_g1_i1:42-485(-)